MKKIAGAVALTLVLGAAGLEGVARVKDLDRAQYQAIAVSTQRVHERGPWQDGEALGVAYLPAGVAWDGSTLETPWGTCRADHPGRTVLFYGDSTTVQTDIPMPDRPAGTTWPDQITWPQDTQVCGLAAEGYHPADYAVLHAQLQPVLEPDLVVVVLCDNDLPDKAAQISVPLEDGMIGLLSPPTHRLVWPPLWQPALYDASEAFRYIHWRLALSTGEQHELPVEDVPSAVEARGALEAVVAGQETLLVRLPPLAGQAASDDLLGELGVRDLELPQDTTSLRRQPEDVVHLNDAGHRHIAPQLQAWIDAALDDGA